MDYTFPSEIYNKFHELRRLKQAKKLFAQRQTSSPNYLPNNQFGGINRFGFIIEPKRRLTIAQVTDLIQESLPSPSPIMQEHKTKINGRDYTFFYLN